MEKMPVAEYLFSHGQRMVKASKSLSHLLLQRGKVEGREGGFR